MLKREIWDDLCAWKKRKHHPLVIRGLRQTGKTYIVKEFGKAFYDNVVYIDLRANKTIHTAFTGDFDVDNMVMAITANMTKSRFIPGKTLLILDEIQDCPDARSSLKYWDIDGRYDTIATGSFLSVKGFRAPYSRGIPVGYEEEMIMYPLSFREFLINTGIDRSVLDYVSKSLESGKMIERTVHESISSLFLQYLIAGGMPEAVSSFFLTHDITNLRSIQKRILNSIRDDFGRYKDSSGNDKVNEVLKLRSEACLASVPSQLAKEYKKFQYSLVDVKGNSPQKADGLEYLEDVGLIVRAYNTRELVSPLEGAKIAGEFKVFMSDIGLLTSMLDDDTPSKILSGELGAYKGAILESVVAALFVSAGRKLYYYHAPSGSPELDFVYEESGSVIIVECKSTNNRATSMKFVLNNPARFGFHEAVKYANANVGGGEGFKTYPLYALGFLKKKEESFIIDTVPVKDLKVPEDVRAGINS